VRGAGEFFEQLHFGQLDQELRQATGPDYPRRRVKLKTRG
jgi:hypothetical protein